MKSNADPHRLFLTALAFGDAGTIVENVMIPENPNQIETFASFVPFVVLEAFTLELLFKCLSLLDAGGYKKTHNLEELFTDLSVARQKRIEELFEREMLRIRPEDRKHFIGLAMRLHDAAESFDEWRYVFENEGTVVFACSPIVVATKAVILEVRPDWAPVAK